MENKEIPLSILIENAKNDYVKYINEVTNSYGLPPYFVWTIFTNIFREMEKNKNNQLAEDIKIANNLENNQTINNGEE